MSNRGHNHTTQTGFSLVELMIALTLGLLLTASIGALFYANKKSYTENNLIAAMQDNSRFAIQALTRDLQMAGFNGGMLEGGLENPNTALPTLTKDCGPGADGTSGWAFDRAPLELMDDVTPANAPAVYACLSAANVLARTDILTVRRVSGRATGQGTTDAPALLPNVLYLRTNGTTGQLIFSGELAQDSNFSTTTSEGVPTSYWEYFARLYFIRNYAVSPGDGIPTLCRAYLKNQTTPTIAIEPLAEGVEDMQIAFGVRNPVNGKVTYRTAPTQDELATAVTARIQLLMRSRDEDHSYTNHKSYNMIGKDDDGDGQVDEVGATPEETDGYRPEDHFYRRIVETTVILRNPALQAGIGVQQ